jgi:hypothetical protein
MGAGFDKAREFYVDGIQNFKFVVYGWCMLYEFPLVFEVDMQSFQACCAVCLAVPAYRVRSTEWRAMTA